MPIGSVWRPQCPCPRAGLSRSRFLLGSRYTRSPMDLEKDQGRRAGVHADTPSTETTPREALQPRSAPGTKTDEPKSLQRGVLPRSLGGGPTRSQGQAV